MSAMQKENQNQSLKQAVSMIFPQFYVILLIFMRGTGRGHLILNTHSIQCTHEKKYVGFSRIFQKV